MSKTSGKPITQAMQSRIRAESTEFKKRTRVNTVAFPNTKRIAVDRDAAAQGKPCIHIIEDAVRASRMQIKCPCCDRVVAEVRWSGNTIDAPAVWVEVADHVPLKIFTDVGDR